jgi:hypothetical protein
MEYPRKNPYRTPEERASPEEAILTRTRFEVSISENTIVITLPKMLV